MNVFRKTLYLSVILAGVISFTACPSQTTISQINQNPSKYQNKEIGLVGTVTNSYGALGQGVYELDDGTGRIWILADRGVPTKGARVGVSGRVYTGVQFGGRNYGIGLREEKRQTKSR